MPPPNVDDPLAHAVYKKCRHSVVLVELRPDPQLVYHRWVHVHPLPNVGNGVTLAEREAEQQKRLMLSAQTSMGTGSWIRSTHEADYILTCAHLVHPVFTQQHPITVDELNELYQPNILCEHREARFLEGHDQVRRFRWGMIRWVSLQNDLLVIRIPKHLMQDYCTEPHRILTYAQWVPKPLKKVVMISWPDYWRSMTTAVGRVSNRRRLIAHLGDENGFGFTATVSEVDITSEHGSSGGPLFNGEFDSVGVLHGGNTKYSYYIALPEIVNTLVAWGMIGPPPGEH